MDQDLCRSEGRSLSGSVRGLKLVTFEQSGVFSSSCRGNISWNSRKSKKDLVFHFRRHCCVDVSANERTQHVDRWRPVNRLCVFQHCRRFVARAKKENGVDSLLLQLGYTTRSIECSY